jgi:hypothetical protein
MFKPEVWKTVSENDFYEVSNYGRVRNKDSGLILKLQKKDHINGGQHDRQIQLAAGGTKTMCLVARLVAEAFLEGFNPRYSVVHQDNNYDNNHIDNLVQDHHLGRGKPPRNS